MPKSKSSKLRKEIRKQRERMRRWDPRGSTCPICRKEFRYGCNHSITEARDRMEENLILNVVRKMVQEEVEKAVGPSFAE